MSLDVVVMCLGATLSAALGATLSAALGKP